MKLQDLALSKDWLSFLAFRKRRLLSSVQTGVPSLDRTLLGLSGVVVLQGAPGCNKSTLALQIAAHQAAKGNPVLVIDRENGRERLRLRLVCGANRVSSTDVMTCTDARLRALVTTVNDWPLFVYHGELRSYAPLREMLTAMSEAFPDKPLMLVVDSIQALPKHEDGADERTSISAWLNTLDQAKLDFDGRLTIIATSEKARGQGGSNYEHASLGAGKGSGSIEYKAEQVLDMRRGANPGSVLVEILKNRDGVSGVAVELRLALATPTNPESFCFKLEEGESL